MINNANYNISLEDFEKIMLYSYDNENIVYGIVLDAMILWQASNRSQQVLTKLLERHGNVFEACVLVGILDALIEYQFSNKINEALLNTIFKLIENRILDEDEEDNPWIERAFTLIAKDFSKERLKNLIMMLKGPYPLPITYHDVYIATLSGYLRICYSMDRYFFNYITLEIDRVADQEHTAKNYEQPFLDRIKTAYKNARANTISINISSKLSLTILGIIIMFFIVAPTIIISKLLFGQISFDGLLITSMVLSYLCFLIIVYITKKIEAVNNMQWANFLRRHRKKITGIAGALVLAVIATLFYDELVRPIVTSLKRFWHRS